MQKKNTFFYFLESQLKNHREKFVYVLFNSKKKSISHAKQTNFLEKPIIIGLLFFHYFQIVTEFYLLGYNVL